MNWIRTRFTTKAPDGRYVIIGERSDGAVFAQLGTDEALMRKTLDCFLTEPLSRPSIGRFDEPCELSDGTILQ